MKRITQEEFNRLNFVPKGVKLNETVQKVMLLNINEAMILTAGEWTLKAAPNTYFYNNQEKLNGMYFKARKLADGGWGVIRIA